MVGCFVTGLLVTGRFFLWVVVSMETLEVGLVLLDTVIDGCVVWTILMVVFVGLLAKSGTGVSLFVVTFFR